MPIAYLSLCKLKQKWLLVTPFMFKKKTLFKAGETETWDESMFPPPPTTPWRKWPPNPSRDHQERNHGCAIK